MNIVLLSSILLTSAPNVSDLSSPEQRLVYANKLVIGVVATVEVALRNGNPRLEFREWAPSGVSGLRTVATPTRWNGEEIIMIGIGGAKAVESSNMVLGSFNVRVHGEEDLALASEDYELVQADLLGATGQNLSIARSQVQRSYTPPTYRYELGQNYPNPFNPTTTIAFSLAENDNVRLDVFNVRGQRVVTVVNQPETKRPSPSGVGRKKHAGVAGCQRCVFLSAPDRALRGHEENGVAPVARVDHTLPVCGI